MWVRGRKSVFVSAAGGEKEDMPKCIVRSCPHKSGKKTQYPDVILHVFPKNLERIKCWLQQTGQDFEDLNGYAQRILEEKKNDNYRICSVHFAPECYTFKGNNKSLRDDALPTIFPDVKGQPMIEESVFYRTHAKRLRRQALEAQAQARMQPQAHVQATTSQITVVPTAFICHADAYRNYLVGLKKDASTQTDFKCFAAEQAVQFPEIMISSMKVASSLSNNDHTLIVPKEPVDEGYQMHRSLSLEEPSRLIQDGSISTLTITSLQPLTTEETGLPMETMSQEVDVTLEEVSEDDMVQERKFLVFESCLDSLFYKLTCGAGLGCTSPVGGFRKHVDGSFLSVTGYCINGHRFQLWQSQPCLERVAVGNLLLSAAILFSGSSFKKVEEMNNILGLQQISEASYSRYQKEFLFATIDHHWLLEHQRVKEEIGKKALCVAGDGLIDSPPRASKYCAYIMTDLSTKNVIDFEVISLDQSRSGTVETAFQNCLDRILNDGFDVHIVTTDSYAGIRKVMREKYSFINHQFNVWHYARDLSKNLVSASKRERCEKIELWIHPIITHFWWSIKTCGRNENLLREKWQSVLYHVTNQHNWTDFELYNSCSHEEIPPEESDDTSWLKKESPAYEHLLNIVKDSQLTKDLPHLSNCCHTGSIVSFRSHMHKYRTKLYFGMDSVAARVKLAILAHNHNVSKHATVPVKSAKLSGMQRKPNRSRGRKRWIVKSVHGEMSNTHLKSMLADLIKVCNGKLLPRRQSQTASTPANLCPVSRPERQTFRAT